jgi:hypothetical protein
MSLSSPENAEARMTQAVAIVCGIPLAIILVGILLALL